jgi:nicotinamidase-related amidase
MTDFAIDRSALVLVDLQRDLLHQDGVLARAGLPSMSPEDRARVLQTCENLVESMRQAGRPIVWVKTELRPDYLDSTHYRAWLDERKEAASNFLIEGSWGAELMEGLTPAPGDFVITKKGHSAFSDTHLDRLLTNLGVDQYVLAGGGTTDSITETVRTGGRLGYEQFVVEDALYPPNSPEVEGFRGQTDVVLAEDIPGLAPQVNSSLAARTAMVLIDMQNDFMKENTPNRDVILANTRQALAAVRERGWPVIYVRVVRREDNLDDSHTPFYNRRRVVVRGLGNGVTHCAVGTWGAEIVDEISPTEGDFIVEKTGGSGFGFTPLHRILRNLRVGRLLVTGGAASGCVQATCMDGAALGYEMVALSDALYGAGPRSMESLARWTTLRPTNEVLGSLDEFADAPGVAAQ